MPTADSNKNCNYMKDPNKSMPDSLVWTFHTETLENCHSKVIEVFYLQSLYVQSPFSNGCRTLAPSANSVPLFARF